LNRPFRSYQPREPKHRRNGKIRAREVRVIDDAKQQLGVMPLSEALRLAQSKGLDLIETVPTEKGAHTTAFDPAQNKIYAFLPQSHRAAVFVD